MHERPSVVASASSTSSISFNPISKNLSCLKFSAQAGKLEAWFVEFAEIFEKRVDRICRTTSVDRESFANRSHIAWVALYLGAVATGVSTRLETLDQGPADHKATRWSVGTVLFEENRTEHLRHRL